MIKSIGFDHNINTLEVEFNNGKVYEYSPITQMGYNELMSANSVGSFFAKNIKGNPSVTFKEV